MSGTIAITMAGRGSRFVQAGYTVPKYEITVFNRPLFDWSMIGLKAFADQGWRFCFAVLDGTGAPDFIRSRCDRLGIQIDAIEALSGVSSGQAETASILAEQADSDRAFAVFNIDTFVRPGALRPEAIRTGLGGWVPCFPAPGEHWSFARLNAAGQVVELREKQRISDHATIGFYWFSSAALYLDTYQRFFRRADALERGERYIAPMYNQLIEDQLPVEIEQLALADIGMLGTPEDVAAFRSNVPAAAAQLLAQGW